MDVLYLFLLKPTGWQSCAKDLACASGCVQAYMRRYAARSGCVSNCKSYARLHNGGPNGCNRESTLTYWGAIGRQGCEANS